MRYAGGTGIQAVTLLSEEPALHHGSDWLGESVYKDLRAIACRRMQGERRAVTLQPTALVHEALLRMLRTPEYHPADRVHFVAVAALQMRRVLVDYAKRRQVNGKVLRQLSFASAACRIPAPDLALLLDRLSGIDARAAQVVDLVYWGGLTHSEVADALTTSVTTVRRDLEFARRWLAAEYGAPA